jgi:hypothetical protein
MSAEVEDEQQYRPKEGRKLALFMEIPNLELPASHRRRRGEAPEGSGSL